MVLIHLVEVLQKVLVVELRVSPISSYPYTEEGSVRSPSPDATTINPFGLWNRDVERDILRRSYDMHRQWLENNPGGNAIHTPNTIRERLLAYRARAQIHSRGLPLDHSTNAQDVSYIRQYNSFIVNNNPPIFNDTVPL